MKHTISEHTLAGGAKGLHIDVPDATVFRLEFDFRAGYYTVEDDSLWEIPHLLEHLVGSNPKYPTKRLFQTELEQNGASYNASTTSYNVTYYIESADFEAERITELMSQMLEQPKLNLTDFKSERETVRDELNGRRNDHFRQLAIAAQQNIGAISKSDGDRLLLIDNLQLEHAKEHFRKTHGAPNLRYAVAGDLAKHPDVIKRLERLNLKDGKRYDLPDEPLRNPSEPLYLEWPGVDTIYFFLEFVLDRKLEPAEEDAMKLLNIMMTATNNSSIFGQGREKGLIYYIYSDSQIAHNSSTWWFGTQMQPVNAPALFELIREEIAKVLQGDLDDAQLAAAKRFALGSYQRTAQTVGGLLHGYTGRYFFDERIDDYYAVPSRIESVTREQVIDVARQMVGSGVWQLAALGTCGRPFVEDLYRRIAPLWEA